MPEDSSPPSPSYNVGDVVNGYRLIAKDDGQVEWVVASAVAPVADAATTPLPVPDAATLVTETRPTYNLGDVANGHQLIAGANGDPTWVPFTPPQRSRRGLVIALSAVGAVLLLLIVVGTVASRPNSNTLPASAGSAQTPEEEPEAVVEPELASVPAGLVGMTASDAQAALEAAGFTVRYDGEPSAKVLSVSPAGDELEVGSTVTLTVEQPPALTISQRNAIGQAESYLAFQSFSRTGLIGQLEFEGYSNADATFAVDTVNPDWNLQAAAKAKSYLEYSSFSRQGLYDQLVFEGFTPDQTNAGLAAVGY